VVFKGWLLKGIIVAGKDKTQVQQKRYRYTGKERDDSSGLCYYGARYLALWLARWISPDTTGVVDGLNLYVYVDNNPLKYIDYYSDKFLQLDLVHLSHNFPDLCQL
jgi:RHS repeat-associated protein